LDELKHLNINMNAIKCSKMDVTLKTVMRECKLPQVADAVRDVMSRWKTVCQSEKAKVDSRRRSFDIDSSGMGDYYDDDDEDAGRITCFISEPMGPAKVSRMQWNAIRKKFNFSQQGIISYVCDGILQDTGADTMFMDVVGMENDKSSASGMSSASSRSQDTHISLIQGPPGTGKTHCIAGMAGALMFFDWADSSPTAASSAVPPKLIGTSKELNKEIDPNDPKIKRLLMCAPSNAAVDELVSRIKKSVPAGNGYPFTGLRLVRLGKSTGGTTGVVGAGSSGPTDVERSTLEWQVEEKVKVTPTWIQLEQCRERVIELEAKQASATASVISNRALGDERNKRSRLERILDGIRLETQRQVLMDAHIVVSTLSSAGRTALTDLVHMGKQFFACIIDEACQATEPSTIIPLCFSSCKRLVLVGDQRQLPATILSRQAEAAGLGVSLFERLVKARHEVLMLTKQYRMPIEIMTWPSEQFYHGALENAADDPQILEAEKKSREKDPRKAREPTRKDCQLSTRNLFLKFFDMPGCMFYDTTTDDSSFKQRQANGTSFVNDGEVDLITYLLAKLTTVKDFSKMSVAVISPYKAQARLIQNQISRHISKHEGTIQSSTVDSFQGKEKDIVIYSCVRTEGLGFTKSPQRLNVAITRSKKALFIIGSADNLARDQVCRSLIDSMQRRALYAPVAKLQMVLQNFGKIQYF